MTTTDTATITVGTGDLRDALRAVLPHALPVKTGDTDALNRIRLTFGLDGNLYVTAANGATTGLAIVSIEQDSRGALGKVTDDGPMIVDVTPRQCALILQQFKAKATDPEGIEQLVKFDIDPEHLELTDDGGLFAGESIRFPALDVSGQMPDLIGIIKAATLGVAPDAGKPLTVLGETLALFKPASVVYSQPLIIESTGTGDTRGFLVSCGEAFLGTVSSRHQDDDSLKRRDAWRHSWLARFGAAQLRMSVA
jgi:hypothetical protein